jgi:hypothetical protein
MTPGGLWSDWTGLDGVGKQIAVAGNVDGCLEVFVVGSDGAVWHTWQTAPNNGWSGWVSMGGGAAKRLAVARLAGRVDVLAIRSDDSVWHTAQTVAGAGPWSDWAPLKVRARQIAAAPFGASMGLFTVDAAGHVARVSYTAAAGSVPHPFAPGSQPPARVRHLAVADAVGRQAVVIVDQNGVTWASRYIAEHHGPPVWPAQWTTWGRVADGEPEGRVTRVAACWAGDTLVLAGVCAHGLAWRTIHPSSAALAQWTRV